MRGSPQAEVGRPAEGHPPEGHAHGRDDDTEDEGRAEEGDAHLEGVEPVEADRLRGAQAGLNRPPLQNFTERNSKRKGEGAGSTPAPRGPPTPRCRSCRRRGNIVLRTVWGRSDKEQMAVRWKLRVQQLPLLAH